MNLFDMVVNDGIELKRVGSTNGGEWSGPCPFCGGRDRFRVWPEHKGGRFWCRGCGKRGDAIQFLMESQGVSYREACRKLNIATAKMTGKRNETLKPKFTARKARIPDTLWIEKAGEFLKATGVSLWTEENNGLAFLKARGLEERTIRQANLGWNKKDLYHDRESWGLLREFRSDGRPKKICLPAGIVIPSFGYDGNLIRIRIRREVPFDGRRYDVIPGSSMAPLIIGKEKEVFCIVESDLDAWLIHQEAGDLVGVCSLGSVTYKPDQLLHAVLTKSALILLSLDADEAGKRESWGFWVNTYGKKVKRWPPIGGKDPGEMLQNGVNIRVWIEAGLDNEE